MNKIRGQESRVSVIIAWDQRASKKRVVERKSESETPSNSVRSLLWLRDRAEFWQKCTSPFPSMGFPVVSATHQWTRKLKMFFENMVSMAWLTEGGVLLSDNLWYGLEKKSG